MKKLLKKLKISKYHFLLINLVIIFSFFTVISKKIITNNFIESLDTNNVKRAFFTSKDNITKNLIELIENEKKSIKAAIYLITDKKIAQALVDAKKRNVDVEFITCHSNLNTLIIKFVENNIKVHIFGTPSIKKGIPNPLMHNKFLIFEKNINDKSILWTGSFNLTCNAQLKNKENVLLIEDKYIISQYLEEFQFIKKQSKTLIKSSNKKTLNNYAAIKNMALTEQFKKTFKILGN